MYRFKLDLKTEVNLSCEDDLFLEVVREDVKQFLIGKEVKRVLLFPPLNSFRRLLIHNFIQKNFGEAQLRTFSVGQDSKRRTAVCHTSLLTTSKIADICIKEKSWRERDSNSMLEQHNAVVTSPAAAKGRQRLAPSLNLYQPPAIRAAELKRSGDLSQPQRRSLDHANKPATEQRSRNRDNSKDDRRSKRPDQQRYVPRPLRSEIGNATNQKTETVVCNGDHGLDRARKVSPDAVARTTTPRQRSSEPVAVSNRSPAVKSAVDSFAQSPDACCRGVKTESILKRDEMTTRCEKASSRPVSNRKRPSVALLENSCSESSSPFVEYLNGYSKREVVSCKSQSQQNTSGQTLSPQRSAVSCSPQGNVLSPQKSSDSSPCIVQTSAPPSPQKSVVSTPPVSLPSTPQTSASPSPQKIVVSPPPVSLPSTTQTSASPSPQKIVVSSPPVSLPSTLQTSVPPSPKKSIVSSPEVYVPSTLQTATQSSTPISLTSNMSSDSTSLVANDKQYGVSGVCVENCSPSDSDCLLVGKDNLADQAASSSSSSSSIDDSSIVVTQDGGSEMETEPVDVVESEAKVDSEKSGFESSPLVCHKNGVDTTNFNGSSTSLLANENCSTETESTAGSIPSKESVTISMHEPVRQPVKRIRTEECDDWETLFNDGDESDLVDPVIIEELGESVGNVKITTASSDYSSYQTVEERTNNGECIVEIYGFPAEFKTRDLMTAFAAYRNRAGFHIQWVDDTHALAVFNSPLVADEVLRCSLPLVRTRPLRHAQPQSRAKARTLTLPPAIRPKTCPALAKRLVSGALGLRIATDRAARENEKLILKEARDQRRLAAKLKDAAWEGTITSNMNS